MRTLFILAFFVASYANAQINCNNTSVGFPPINDLGSGMWNGYQGGLYPNGSNYLPAAHKAAGIAIANQIKPLDATGNVDLANGKIVWISVGMSNTSMEASTFIKKADSIQNIPNKNPKVKLMDGGVFGNDIDLVDTSANYWNIVMQRLSDSGLTAQQVEVVWFKETRKAPTDPVFPNFSNELLGKFKIAMNLLKVKFPNVKICYIASRIYGGYAGGVLNPEPYAYYQGWACKWLIEAQINGDPSLQYSGPNANSPYLAWGTYLWADGTTPRNDGLTWQCSDLLQNDGVHPSTPQGRNKVANILKTFFTADSTATPWFLLNPTGIKNEIAKSDAVVYPNPFMDHVSITVNQEEKIEDAELLIYDVLGHVIRTKKNIHSGKIELENLDFPSGIYFYVLKTNKDCIAKGKLIAQ